MPNRVLRDWTASDKIDSLSQGAEVFFTRLIMKADDFGFYHGGAKILNSTLFPLKDYENKEVAGWLAECVAVGIIFKYSVDGKDYVQIIDFDQRLRQMKSKFPPPSVNCQSDDGQLSVNGRLETKRNETKGKEGTIPIRPGYDPTNYYQTPSEAFEEIKANETLMEQLTRIVHQQGFRTAQKVHVMVGVKKFLTVEGAKDEFKLKPKSEVKNHLINWMNKNAARITETNGIS